MIKKIDIKRCLFQFVLPTLLVGCVDLSPYQQNPALVISEPPYVYKSESGHDVSRGRVLAPLEQKREVAASDAVVLALLHEAKVTQEKGDLSTAISTIERGLRIRPRDPLFWHQLARLRLQQGKAVLAENLARKSNTLTRENYSLRKKNLRIIASALRLQGKNKAAQEIDEKSKRMLR